MKSYQNNTLRLITCLLISILLAVVSSCKSEESADSDSDSDSVSDDTVVHNAEGSTSDPVALAVAVNHAGDVDETTSYYIADVSTDNSYTISLSGFDDDVDLYCFNSESSFTYWEARSFQAGLLTESCNFKAGSDKVYISVKGNYSNSGSNFAIVIKINPCASGCLVGSAPSAQNQGSAEAPVTGECLSFWGCSVGASGTSYYYREVVADVNYALGISGLSSDVNLIYYGSDDSFSSSVCTSTNTGTTDEVCSITPTGDKFYYSVTSTSGSYFTNTLFASAESSSNPVEIPIGKRGEITAGPTSSFFKIPATTGEIYKFIFYVQNGNPTLTLYDGNQFTTPVVCSITYGELSCPITAAENAISLKMDIGGGTIGAKLTYQVVKYGVEGLIGSPISITLDTPHSGQNQQDDDSYYKIADFSYGLSYQIKISGLTDRANLNIYNDNYTTLICPKSSGSRTAPVGIFPETYSIIQGEGGDFFFKVNGSNSTGSGYTVEVNQVDKPDLTIAATAWSEPTTDVLQIDYTITNGGTSAVPSGTSFNVDLFLDPSPVPKPMDSGDAVSTVTLSAPIAVDATFDGSISMSTASGGGVVYLVIDQPNAVDELYECDTNNISSSFGYGI